MVENEAAGIKPPRERKNHKERERESFMYVDLSLNRTRISRVISSHVHPLVHPRLLVPFPSVASTALRVVAINIPRPAPCRDIALEIEIGLAADATPRRLLAARRLHFNYEASSTR